MKALPDFTATVNEELTYFMLGAKSLTTELLSIFGNNGIHIRLKLNFSEWERCCLMGAFHLDELDGSPPGFDGQSPVVLTLRLRPALERRLVDEPNTMIEMLLDENEVFRHTEAWVCIELIQQLAVPGEEGLTVDVGVRLNSY